MRFIRLLGRYINAVVMATHEEYCHKYGDGNVGSAQLKIDEKEHPEDHVRVKEITREQSCANFLQQKNSSALNRRSKATYPLMFSRLMAKRPRAQLARLDTARAIRSFAGGGRIPNRA